MNYTVTLTDTEKLAMEYIAYEPQDWVENAMKERARIAIDEIVKIAVDKFFEIRKKQINSMLANTDKKIQRVAPFIKESLESNRILNLLQYLF